MAIFPLDPSSGGELIYRGPSARLVNRDLKPISKRYIHNKTPASEAQRSFQSGEEKN